MKRVAKFFQRYDVMFVFWLVAILALCTMFSGCTTMGRGSAILVSKEQQWTIPQGQPFQAIQKPKYEKPTDFVADEDLMVLYKGKYLEEEKLWNDRAFKMAKDAETKGKVTGIVGSLLGVLLALLSRWGAVKLRGKPKA